MISFSLKRPNYSGNPSLPVIRLGNTEVAISDSRLNRSGDNKDLGGSGIIKAKSIRGSI